LPMNVHLGFEEQSRLRLDLCGSADQR
jgi:hypothetical protein